MYNNHNQNSHKSPIYPGYPYSYTPPVGNPYAANLYANQYIPPADYNGYVYPYDYIYPMNQHSMELKDYGPEPFAVNIEEATLQNDNFRTALWTGDHLQVTLMSINPGEDIGFEVHPNLDQFLRIEEGQGLALMGNSQDTMDFQAKVYDGIAVIIPAGKWHNVVNTGYTPLKLYSIYAPPQHPFGTVHKTREDAIKAEEHETRK